MFFLFFISSFLFCVTELLNAFIFWLWLVGYFED